MESNKMQNITLGPASGPLTRRCTNMTVKVTDSQGSLVFSFDKLINYDNSRPFNPTLSLLMLPRESSNIKTSTETGESSYQGSDKNNIPGGSDPVIIYRFREDHEIKRNQFFLSIFAKILAICSILLFVIAIWIEYLMPQCFTALVLRTGALHNFSLHYALVLDSFLGLVASIVILILRAKRNLEKYILQVVNVVGFCSLWGFISTVYSFGANILYEYELEEMMVKELKLKGDSSLYWTSSQNFFHCCGISSYKSWDWNLSDFNSITNQSPKTYPISCCDSKSSCEQRPNESEIYITGCLNPEMDFLLGLAYVILILMIFHFFLEIFSLMVTMKIHMRRRLIKELTEKADVKRQSSKVSTSTEMVITHGQFSEQTLLAKKYQNIESQVKRSSTL